VPVSEISQFDPIPKAKRFAEALDRDDFATAGTMLAPGCIYQTTDGPLVGAAAICDSYREASNWGKQHLDLLSYESEVQVAQGTAVTIVFIDHIEHRGQAHTYRCAQALHFGAYGFIERIEHVELPGQREALVSYLASVGVSRG